MKTKFLYYLLICCLNTMVLSAQVQIGQDIDGDSEGERSGLSVQINGDGEVVAIGSHWYDNARGRVRVFHYDGSNWTQKGQDLLGLEEFNWCGNVSIDQSGDIVAVGAGSYDNNRGHVRIYQYDGASWQQMGNDILGEAEGDASGVVLTMSDDGSRIAIGAVNNDGGAYNAGHVRIFEFDGSDWQQLGSDIDGEQEADYMGNSLSFNNDATILAIGVSGFQNVGQVKIYQFNGNEWAQLGPSIDGDEQESSQSIVSLNGPGNEIVVGNIYASGTVGDAGTVKIFRLQDGAWIQKGSTIEGEQNGDRIGGNIAIADDGRHLAVGCAWSDNFGLDAGEVRFYYFNGQDWETIGNRIGGENPGDGAAVLSLNGGADKIVIGSGDNDDNGPDTGHARVFDLSGILGAEQFGQNNFAVYPNPATDLVHIGGTTMPLQARMYNSLGQMVFEGSLTDRFSVTSFPAGMYLLVLSDDKRSERHRIIKH